ncbi:MaoC family dehydratase [Chitinasiproducens palmae]|uniref:Acyl dehydratase n=1 Tax=Chitinasiproducens palmae TaxID=1770053 RepID=A0A1H2PS44_9BURK|nr:MaoC family dehydratase [Chitinasiproducens palmae]SDV49735.1 Acyl dehydratase [Chitinasiproducens palmae]
MKFAEFEVGQTIVAGPREVDAAEIVAFARQYDPQPFHVDPERAAGGRWGGLIASGWMTCGIAMRLACDAALDGSESFGSPGLDYLKWSAPVRAGDALTLTATVLEKRRSSSQPTLGVLRWRWLVSNGRETVLDLVATSFFDLSGDA